MAHAIHRNARISPRKARLVADLIRPRVVRVWDKETRTWRREVRPLNVEEAKRILHFTRKRAAPFLWKVVQSAFKNAGPDADETQLFVRTVVVNEGFRTKVLFPRPRGTGSVMTRPHCHIRIEVDEGIPVPSAAPPGPPPRSPGPAAAPAQVEGT